MMRSRCISVILVLAMLFTFAYADESKIELAPYSLHDVSKIRDTLNLFLIDDGINVGGDDMRGQWYASREAGLSVKCNVYGEIVDITIGAGGGEYSLFGISLGMTPFEAKEALHAYCGQNAILIGYEEWNEQTMYSEFEYDEAHPDLYYGDLSVSIDNGVITEINQYYL